MQAWRVILSQVNGQVDGAGGAGRRAVDATADRLAQYDADWEVAAHADRHWTRMSIQSTSGAVRVHWSMVVNKSHSDRLGVVVEVADVVVVAGMRRVFVALKMARQVADGAWTVGSHWARQAVRTWSHWRADAHDWIQVVVVANWSHVYVHGGGSVWRDSRP
jgi:hypothetical protein